MEEREIILTVVAIIGLAVVLGFFFIFRGTDTSKSACELSVLTRATTEAGQGYIPLKCQTEKICLSDGSGDRKCGNRFIGEDVTKVSLKKDTNEAVKKTDEILAREMYDCWNMMGQGKLSLFTKGVLDYHGLDGKKATTCVICSRIAVEHSKSNEVFNQMNFENYLATSQVPGRDVTYLQAFSDKQFNSFPVSGINSQEVRAISEAKDGVEFKETDNSQMAIVFTQVSVAEPEKVLKRLAITGTGVFAGGAFVLGIGNMVKALTTKIVIIPLIVAGIGVTAISMANTYQSRTAAAGYCGQFTTASGDDSLKNGCSTIMIVPYNADTINQICKGGYEGSP